MKYDFEHEVPRFGTYSMKWNDDAFFRIITPNIRLDKDTIRLNLADMDFRCAPAIAKAMHRVADFENYGYTTPNSAPEYKESIINWYKRRHDMIIQPEWIIHSNGALDGVEQTILAFSRPGEGVILCRPIYRNFTSVTEKTGRHVDNCQMINHGDGNYEMDWESLEKVCAKPENKVFVLCSPQNPVGRVWTNDELCKIARICRDHDVIVVSDEIHSDIIRKGVKHIPILDAVDDLSNIIMVSGVNKSFNLMGLHCAYSVIPDEDLRKKFQEGYDPAMPTPFAIAGTIAAYNESEDWLDELNEYLDDAMSFTVSYIKEKLPKCTAYLPQGSYVLWLDFSDYGYPMATLQELIYQKANVALQKGTSHDPGQGDGFMRLCVTCSKANLKTAVDRIAAAFDEYEKSAAETKE
ncbi:MAG: aminotransferase class I/II-fold pyridoxal phosphate-dependent enzyme [Clostridiales bacterium]|nr:aminotransferase class I/II-fold pyridoxal phosphate-dependent enzyme [Clostridiales bacterium]